MIIFLIGRRFKAAATAMYLVYAKALFLVVEVVFDAFHFLDSQPKPVYIVDPATEKEQ